MCIAWQKAALLLVLQRRLGNPGGRGISVVFYAKNDIYAVVCTMEYMTAVWCSRAIRWKGPSLLSCDHWYLRTGERVCRVPNTFVELCAGKHKCCSATFCVAVFSVVGVTGGVRWLQACRELVICVIVVSHVIVVSFGNCFGGVLGGKGA